MRRTCVAIKAYGVTRTETNDPSLKPSLAHVISLDHALAVSCGPTRRPTLGPAGWHPIAKVRRAEFGLPSTASVRWQLTWAFLAMPSWAVGKPRGAWPDAAIAYSRTTMSHSDASAAPSSCACFYALELLASFPEGPFAIVPESFAGPGGYGIERGAFLRPMDWCPSCGGRLRRFRPEIEEAFRLYREAITGAYGPRLTGRKTREDALRAAQACGALVVREDFLPIRASVPTPRRTAWTSAPVAWQRREIFRSRSKTPQRRSRSISRGIPITTVGMARRGSSRTVLGEERNGERSLVTVAQWSGSMATPRRGCCDAGASVR
jgi:hypothetical protein